MEAKINAYGLYDAPVRRQEQNKETLSEADMERQLEAGAFVLPFDEAVSLGLLNPYDMQDVVSVSVEGDSHE